MKKYKKVEVNEVEAVQYGNDTSAEKYIEECVYNSKGEISSANNGFMSIVRDPFSGVKTSTGYKRIAKGDWIVKKGEEVLVVSNDVFQMMFVEK